MSDSQRIKKLPKWAQEHICDLERRVETAREASNMLPWSEDGMEWFAIDNYDRDKPLRLFTCNEFGTKPLAILYGRDRMFIGRAEARFHGRVAMKEGGE